MGIRCLVKRMDVERRIVGDVPVPPAGGAQTHGIEACRPAARSGDVTPEAFAELLG
jgi:hypothetical protein